MLMGLNLARRASRSGATFRSDVDKRGLFEADSPASGARSKRSAADSKGRFKFLESGGTTVLMRVSMGLIVTNQDFQAVTGPERQEIC